jgi:hypothetical protein
MNRVRICYQAMNENVTIELCTTLPAQNILSCVNNFHHGDNHPFTSQVEQLGKNHKSLSLTHTHILTHLILHPSHSQKKKKFFSASISLEKYTQGWVMEKKEMSNCAYNKKLENFHHLFAALYTTTTASAYTTSIHFPMCKYISQ